MRGEGRRARGEGRNPNLVSYILRATTQPMKRSWDGKAFDFPMIGSIIS